MKPILFNTEMVRAILDGKKTTTRRVIKPQPEPAGRALFFKDGLYGTEDALSREANYKPGDILYVRETWQKFGRCFIFKADADKLTWWKNLNIGKWHPSIYMPKDATRIFLRVTDVRAKQLHDITEEQIKQEGIEFVSGYNVRDIPLNTWDYFEMLFKRLWNSTVKKTDLDKYGWDANPWVWVIEFERCEKPKEKAGK